MHRGVVFSWIFFLSIVIITIFPFDNSFNDFENVRTLEAIDLFEMNRGLLTISSELAIESNGSSDSKNAGFFS